jgi:hypothetical protein
MKKKHQSGFDWHRRHYDHAKFIRATSVAISFAIIFIITMCSIVSKPKLGETRWCDARTMDCFDQLLPLRGAMK